MTRPADITAAGRPGHSILGIIGCLAVIAVGCGGPTRADVASSSTPSAARTDTHAPVAREHCPRTPGGRGAKGVAITLGRGPAYPVLGMQAAPPAALGVVVLNDDLHLPGVYLHKTLWAVRPGARDEIVVHAASLAGRRPVGFFDGPQPRTHAALRSGTRAELRLARGPGQWAYATTTVLPGPGCYAFRLRGGEVDQRIIFQAVLMAPAAGAASRTRGEGR